MAVYIWSNVYYVAYGQADAIVLADCLDSARQLLLDRLCSREFPDRHPERVVVRDPDKIIDGAGVAFLEWEE